MDYEFGPGPPTIRQRLVAGAFGAIFGLSLANAYFDWRLVGDFSWEMVIAMTILGVIILTYFMPSARQ